MKKTLFLVAVFMYLVVSCSKSNDNLLKEISGVWRAKQDGTMITVNYDNKTMMFALGEDVIPTTLGVIDNENKTVNLNVNLINGKPGVWTLKQVWDKEKKSFHLVLTLHDGTQDELSFIRKISSDDLIRLTSNERETASGPVSPTGNYDYTEMGFSGSMIVSEESSRPSEASFPKLKITIQTVSADGHDCAVDATEQVVGRVSSNSSLDTLFISKEEGVEDAEFNVSFTQKTAQISNIEGGSRCGLNGWFGGQWTKHAADVHK